MKKILPIDSESTGFGIDFLMQMSYCYLGLDFGIHLRCKLVKFASMIRIHLPPEGRGVRFGGSSPIFIL